MNNAWQGFKQGRWTKEIDVRGFIQANYTPYEGDSSFLALKILQNFGTKF